jgi:glyoxylase-like metal-dependent hydrolase (beta-lactamase superfamily II)
VKIHALSTGTVRIKAAMRYGHGPGPLRQVNTLLGREFTEPLPIHIWVIEHAEGVIVVDTGELSGAPALPFARFEIAPEDEIGPQLRRLGIAPGDVRTVVLTHLHGDHMDGVGHLAGRDILVHEGEYRYVKSLQGRLNAAIGRQTWPAGFVPRTFAFLPEPLGPFSRSYPLTAAGDVVVVPTPGHTPGHSSIVVLNDGVSYFLAGDTSYTQRQLLEGCVDGVSPNAAMARRTMGLIVRYAAEYPTLYLPSHDPESAARLAGGSLLVGQTSGVPAR